ncbi:DUF6233 domain-containing protein [Streptomyces sp. NPDC001984]|uniref:DUF6233 domain-containing protein n=1 Tax=Streptomyces sp. NPDC002619 TaxID=3364655 RepID=UPI003696755C
MIEQRRTPDGPLEAAAHLDDCKVTSDQTHPVSAHEARLALTMPSSWSVRVLPPGHRAGDPRIGGAPARGLLRVRLLRGSLLGRLLLRRRFPGRGLLPRIR